METREDVVGLCISNDTHRKRCNRTQRKVKRLAAASIVTSQPLTLKGAPLFLQMKIETLQQLLAAKARYRNFQKWADAAGVKAQTIWKWQRGTATPSVRLLKRVCAAVETGIAAESD